MNLMGSCLIQERREKDELQKQLSLERQLHGNTKDKVRFLANSNTSGFHASCHVPLRRSMLLLGCVLRSQTVNIEHDDAQPLDVRSLV